MFVVVDVNVIISSLYHKGDSLNVFILNSIFNKFDFVIPDFFLVELNKHTERIQRESKLPNEEIIKIADFVTRQISVITQSEFEEFLPKAKEIAKNHLKDVPYIALSLKLNCPIFSGDRTLKEIYFNVLPPKEMLEKFYTL